jgi:hypothetical protein
LIGFYINDGGFRGKAGDLRRVLLQENSYLTTEKEEAKKKEWKENGFVTVDDSGYDEYYVIKGSSLEFDPNARFDTKLDKTKTVSIKKISAAFKKFHEDKVKTRVLLKKFVEKIA